MWVDNQRRSKHAHYLRACLRRSVRSIRYCVCRVEVERKNKASTTSRNRIKAEKINKMNKSVGYQCASKAARRREREIKVGIVWNDTDVVFLWLDKHIGDVEILAREKKAKKVFHAWKEGWEKLKPKSKMHPSNLGLCTSMAELNWII